jgi:hypothetical protein
MVPPPEQIQSRDANGDDPRDYLMYAIADAQGMQPSMTQGYGDR